VDGGLDMPPKPDIDSNHPTRFPCFPATKWRVEQTVAGAERVEAGFSSGRPSIDSELITRMLIVGYCYGIRSERRLVAWCTRRSIAATALQAARNGRRL
jgi:Transposase domain (DUF772)